MSDESIQSQTVLCGTGSRYHYEGAMPLGIRTFRGGIARYHTAAGEYAVDDSSWLILNNGEHYRLCIDSPARVLSTVVFFPEGRADLVARIYRESPDLLLDDPAATGQPVRFLEVTVSSDRTVTPLLNALDAACRGKQVESGWLEEQLYDLLAGMLLSQREHRARAARLPSARPSTREELYRRLCRGREFARAEALRAPKLAEIASHACLSPYHFQRAYTIAFNESPHDTMQGMRLDQACRLLRHTHEPVIGIAAAVGFESVGAFNRAFRHKLAVTPSAFRKN